MARAKPKGGAISGGKIGLTGTDVFIDATDLDYDFENPVFEATGDGDTAPEFDSMEMVYGRLSIAGWMISGQKPGVASGSFASGTALPITLTLSNGISYAGSLLITRCGVKWRQGRPAIGIPIRLAGVFTGTITEGYSAP